MTTIPRTSDLLEKVKNELKITDGQTAIDTQQFWSRSMILGDITAEVGDAIENLIRFWNTYDEENNIPVTEREPIKVYIDSDGGDLYGTLTIIDAITLSKTPVWTINIGCAYSGGFFIFICGNKRIAYPHASFLYHEGSVQNGGTAIQFRNFSEFHERKMEELKEITLD
jgi:ATP-dependent protease ClpP protease subunit